MLVYHKDVDLLLMSNDETYYRGRPPDTVDLIGSVFLFYRDEDLVLKVNDEVYYRGRLPDTVIIDQCKVKRVSQRRGESRIKILLTKENSGLWLPGWLIEA